MPIPRTRIATRPITSTPTAACSERQSPAASGARSGRRDWFSGGYDSAAIAGLAGPALAGRKLVAAASVMPVDYRGTIRHARRWIEMCARDMPHLDVHHVTRDGKSVLSGLEQAFLDSEMPAGSYHFVQSELLATLSDAGAQVIVDGHGGDYTLHPRGQAALARFLATFQLRRFVSELRGHLHMTGRSLWTTLKLDLAPLLLPSSLMALWRRVRHGAAPVWRDQPIDPVFAEKLIAQSAVDKTNLRIAATPKLDMRRQMAAMLRRVTSSSVPGMAANAARHGLELTRPFHDKRVVELALAIPQDLYVKNGRNRYLACAALKDIYPREFQTRWRRNDDEIPDFQRMAKSIEPQLLAEICTHGEVQKPVAHDRLRQDSRAAGGARAGRSQFGLGAGNAAGRGRFHDRPLCRVVPAGQLLRQPPVGPHPARQNVP